MSQEQIDKLDHKLGLDAPMPVQYLRWLGGLVHLDFGRSLQPSHDSIGEMLLERAPVAAELAVGAIAVALVIAVPLGVASALYQNTWVDYVLRVFTIAGLSVPVFWLGVLTIILLERYLGYTAPVD